MMEADLSFKVKDRIIVCCHSVKTWKIKKGAAPFSTPFTQDYVVFHDFAVLQCFFFFFLHRVVSAVAETLVKSLLCVSDRQDKHSVVVFPQKSSLSGKKHSSSRLK